jgi:hypothetical protein
MGNKHKKEVHTQKIDNKKGKKLPPTIEYEYPKTIEIDPKYANAPVRTVFYVEVGNMAPDQVSLLSAAIADQYKNAKGGIHYIMPVRDGKLGPDVIFEEEFLKIVDKICEIENGAIVLKDGAKEVYVIRQKL